MQSAARAAARQRAKAEGTADPRAPCYDTPVHVACVRMDFHIPGCRSLKEKRGVVKRLVERTRARFNVTIAEVADNDLHQRACVGFAVVGNEVAFVTEVADKVRASLRGSGLANVIDDRLEIVTL
ncbi:MAG TPA: DUF503 domain-containing protein [Myxococcota bacterium]|nr:DUF503 domain-containing protein [Myxococcota bacterium]